MILSFSAYDFVSSQSDRALMAGKGSVEFIRSFESDVPYAQLVPDDFDLRALRDRVGGVVAWFDSDRGGLLLQKSCDSTTVHLTIVTNQLHVAEDIFHDVQGRAGTAPPTVKHLRIWTALDGTYDSDRRPMLKRCWSEIRGNYPRAIGRMLGDLMASGPPQGSARLMLWHGEPGTGKTSAALALIDAWYDWLVPHVISDPEQLFHDPSYLRRLMGFKVFEKQQVEVAGEDRQQWNLLVCEDADEFLRTDARSRSGPALGRLLNATDGVMAQQARCLILLTTNAEVGSLHPAIARPGRCLSQLHFARFSRAEASGWLGHPSPADEPTLAELFALRNGCIVEQQHQSAGGYL
ncbi:MAG: putative family ATPase [Frankiales bacterium]|nr:putative family ATPase [Frankiales bacterium]